MRPLFALLKRGGVWSLITRVMTGVFNLLVGVFLARLLTAEHFGLYFLVLQVTRIFALFNGCGIPNALLKLASIAESQKHWRAIRHLIKHSVFLLVLMSLVIGTVWATLWPSFSQYLFKNEFSNAIAIVIFLLIVLRAIEEVGSAFLRAVGKIGQGFLFSSFLRELCLTLIFFFLFLNLSQIDIEEVLMLHVVTSGIVSVVLVIVIRQFCAHHPHDLHEDDGNSFKDFCAISFPVLLHGASSVIFSSSDIWILGLFRPVEEVGIYGAVTRLGLLIVFLLNAVNMVIPPIVASLYYRGEMENLERVLRLTATLSLVIAAPILLVYLFFGEFLLGLLFGPAFEQGLVVLFILALGQVVNVACGSPGVLLQMTGNHQLLSKITLFVACLNLLGNLVVVERFGPEGVATVTATSIIFQNIMMTYLVYQKTGIVTLPSFSFVQLGNMMRLLRDGH